MSISQFSSNMAMFDQARRFTISGGTFTVVQGDFNLNAMADPMQRGMDILRQHIVPGAFHNSDERYDAPTCHPHTREVVLTTIMDWLQDPKNLHLFLWLYGPAGSGKSSIAQTIANMCHQAGILLATFFFSRSASGRNDKTHLIPTIAYQLTLSIPAVAYHVARIINEDPLIFSRALTIQIQSLIIDPLNQLAALPRVQESLRRRKRLIIIDGLDECADAKSHRYILDALSYSARQLIFPIHFLIASRPEQHVRDAYNVGDLSSQTMTLPLDNTYRPDDDIRAFLESKFDEIKERHPSRQDLPADWPKRQDLEKLVENSSGQFIYAATVMKYIESPQHWPTERLDIILGVLSPGKDTPFAELDAVYHHILSSVKNVSQVLEILYFIMKDCAPPPSREQGVFGYTWGDVQIILSDMHALVHVPEDAGAIRPHHASLNDFLQDRTRSKEFFLYSPEMHANYARRWIKYFMGQPYADYPHAKYKALEIFVQHCENSYLTKELTEDLYCFDVVAHIEFAHPVLDLDFRNFVLLRSFFRSIGSQEDLKRHQLGYFDRWFTEHLSKYSDDTRSHLTTALTFPSIFPQCSMQLYYGVFSYKKNPIEVEAIKTLFYELWNFIHRFDADDWDAFSSLAFDFLDDASRSRSDYVDGDKYTAFSRHMADCLFNSKGREAALLFLPESLPKASRDAELALLLRDSSLYFGHGSTRSDVYREKVKKLVMGGLAYIKRCDIPILAHSYHPDHDICIMCDSTRRTTCPGSWDPDV